ncbi:MAG TPA: ComF family protein [bacterium]|nr:ComF family protein [bacterium]
MALLRAAADLLFPPACQVCRAPGPFPLCAACLAAMPLIRPPWCAGCGQPLDAAGGGVGCRWCRRRPSAFVRVRSSGIYAGVLREAIHALKFQGCRAMARPLGVLMARAAADDPFAARPDVVVPVPLHPTRLRARGFNQSALLASVVARELGGPATLEEALVRTDLAISQVRLAVDERRRNVRDAFAARIGLEGRRIVLVDDVVATGATAAACVKALRAAGAARVLVLTAARAVLGRPVQGRPG